jgi:type II secretory pathway component GspD/PulD (secretin)
MKLTKFAIAFAITAGLAGCASSFEWNKDVKNGELMPGRQAAMQAARGTTFVREIKSEDLAKQRLIYLTAKSKPLLELIQQTLPGYVIIPRGMVDLKTPIDVAANGMTVGQLIEYIEGTSDLHMEIEGNKIYISNFETREWNLAAFAATRSVTTLVSSAQTSGAKAGDSDQSSNNPTSGSDQATRTSVGYSLTEDEWVKIINGARTILNVQASQVGTGSAQQLAAPGQSVYGQNGPRRGADGGLSFDGMPPIAAPVSINIGDQQQPYLEGIRSVGIVTAGGSPAKMRVLDRYLRKAIAESTKVINVSVEAYDVVLNDDKQKGINWGALVKASINGNPFDLVFGNSPSVAPTPVPDSGFWNVGGSYAGDRGNVNFLLKFLETFGRVELKDQPNLTVRNGVPAQIYAGQELTYIVDVEQSQDQNGNVTVTPRLGRLKIGVTLSVTVRVLDDDQLLVDITPVLSNLNAPDTISLGTTSFQTPRVALKEFSTQLVTTSGRSVHLGGLISERMSKALEQLPWQNLVTKAVLNPLTQNINNTLERRELVLVVTPTLIEGAN